MTGRQRSKLGMLGAVESVCSQYRHVWGQLPAFRSAFERYQTELTALTNVANAQRRDTGGIAQDKVRKRLELCELAFEVAAAVRASALASGDTKAANKLAFSLTQLRIGKDTVCVERCRQVLATAQNHKADLDAYGVTDRKMAELKNALDEFAETVTKTRSVRDSNKGVTGQLPALFARTEQILYNQLDNLMPQFRNSAPRFYNQFREARVMKTSTTSEVVSYQPETEEPAMID